MTTQHWSCLTAQIPRTGTRVSEIQDWELFQSLRIRKFWLRMSFFFTDWQQEYDDEFRRVSGSVVCPACGLLYYDHPDEPGLEFLNRICNGDLVKL